MSKHLCLIDEHWRAKAIGAVQHYRDTDPEGWASYIAEAEKFSQADAPITDDWGEAK